MVRNSDPKLINEPRDFAIEELFFSTTDLKGRIQRANSVFCRISGYSWEDLRNQPHNIVRHPDMPRAIFHLFWDYIESGRPIVAYVKNQAHDTRYYWVVALAVPISGGYLSVRFKPTSPFFVTVRDLYTNLKAIEASIEDVSQDRKAAIAASTVALEKAVTALGFRSYDDLMQQLLKQEMQCREARLHQGATRGIAALAEMTGYQSVEVDSLRKTAQMFDQLLEVLNVLFQDLEAYVDINRGVREKSESLTDIAESLRVSALNGAIETDKLGSRALGLRPVLDWLRSFSGEITQEGVHLSASLVDLIHEIDSVVFGLSAAKLQIEMTALFAHELLDLALSGRQQGVDRMTEGAIECLHSSSCETVHRALQGLAAVKSRLHSLTATQLKMLNSSRFLRPLYLRGKIEMADGAGPKLAMVFNDVSNQLDETSDNLKGLRMLLEDLEAHLIRGLAHGDRVDETIAMVDGHLSPVLR